LGDDPEEDPWTGRIVSLTYEGAVAAAPEPTKEFDEDDPEEFAKFQVLKACSWVLGVQLLGREPIREPKSWSKLARTPVEWTEHATTTYKGAQISKEDLEDLERLGQGARIRLG
jgi:hypothetical protein